MGAWILGSISVVSLAFSAFAIYRLALKMSKYADRSFETTRLYLEMARNFDQVTVLNNDLAETITDLEEELKREEESNKILREQVYGHIDDAELVDSFELLRTLSGEDGDESSDSHESGGEEGSLHETSAGIADGEDAE